jgi:trehalose 6-phosphate phosphatase
VDDLSRVVVELRADPPRTALLLDFDGTLAPIVEDPAAAVPLPGTVEALVHLHSL